jgi:hypothetical protein
MELNNKGRRQIRRRNFVAKELRDQRFRHQVVKDKRHHLIDVIHEHEADEDLFDYFGLGKAPKE